MSPTRAFFNVVTRDLAAARNFYVDLLGFSVAFSSEWFVQLRGPGDGPELGFLHPDHAVVPESARERPTGGMLTIVVPDVDPIHERAVASGVEILEAPRNLFYGQRRMLVRDPDGTIVDISSECPPDPQWMNRVERTQDGAYIERSSDEG